MKRIVFRRALLRSPVRPTGLLSAIPEVNFVL